MTQPLWIAADVVAATGGTSPGGFAAFGVAIDSRTVAAGDLFVALRGERHDGHDHAAAALAAGAAAVLVARRPSGIAPDAPVVEVDDTYRALNRLASAARARTAARIVAVTGSVGKTTTKDALALALGAHGRAVASLGNLNNHIGVPLSLARLPADAGFGVFELAMNHAGEIAPLARLVRPDVAIITTVAPAHLEAFADETGIADEKASIVDGLEPGGTLLLNRDNRHYQRLADYAARRGGVRIIGFGEHESAEARLLDYEANADGAVVRATVLGTMVDFRLGLPGRHQATNALAVLAAVAALGLDVAAAAARLHAMRPTPGRGAARTLAWRGGTITVIDDSYNASPASVAAAIAVLGGRELAGGGRRIVVLGDMLELGPSAPALHAALAEPMAQAAIDLVFTAGRLSQALHEALPATRRGGHAADAAALAPVIRAAIRPGDTITVKGSLGSQMKLVVDALAGPGDPSGSGVGDAV